MKMKLSSSERSRRIVDIIAHQLSMFCPRRRRKGIVLCAELERRRFWRKDFRRIKRPDGVVGEAILLETCIYRCVSAIRRKIDSWNKGDSHANSGS